MPELIFWDVDTQHDFMCEAGKLYVPGAEEIVPQLERLTNFAHESRILVVASADHHDLTDPEISDAPDFRETFPPHCLRGTPGQAKVPSTQLRDPLILEPEALTKERIRESLSNHDGDILFHKSRFDVFSNPNVEPVLDILDPSEVVVYGVALDVCNKFAIEGFLERRPGMTITLVTDATKAINPSEGERLLAEWSSRGVLMSTTDEVVSHIESEVRS